MLGEQIRKLRLARNISQVQLAQKLDVSKQSVSNWENNNILPSVEVLVKIAKFFRLLHGLPAGVGQTVFLYRHDQSYPGTGCSHSAAGA